MSAYKHRQPIVGWSSVVLLSALLLSPMTAGALLHALAHAFPQAFAAANSAQHEDSSTENAAATEVNSAPSRRANDEQQALLRAALRASRRRAVRRDTDPQRVLEGIPGGTVAVLVPTRTMERVADIATALRSCAFPRLVDARLRVRQASPVPPRAPPA